MHSTTTECAVLFIAEGEVFQIKKPSHSKRIVKQLKKESLKDKNDDVAPVKFEVSSGTEQLQVCVCVRVLIMMFLLYFVSELRKIAFNRFDSLCELMKLLD